MFVVGLVSHPSVLQSQIFTFSHVVEQVSEISCIILLGRGVRWREGEGKRKRERAGGVKLKKSRERRSEGGRQGEKGRERETERER